MTDENRKWWSFQPLGNAQPPAVKSESWWQVPIDRFVLAKLEDKGIAANAVTDKRVLIRRAYFDLIGLPPTPEQIDRFLADAAPDAYEKVIDELAPDDPAQKGGKPGRDHNPHAFTTWLAGGGVKGGVHCGETDVAGNVVREVIA